MGLCGNFNGIQNDDFTTKYNHSASDAASFGNFWKVEKSCPDVVNMPYPCKSAGRAAQITKRHCFSLRYPPFDICNKVLNPNVGYIPNCLHDVCGCGGNPIACLCEAYAAYSEDCRAAGVIINWKSLGRSRKCSKCNLRKTKNHDLLLLNVIFTEERKNNVGERR